MDALAAATRAADPVSQVGSPVMPGGDTCKRAAELGVEGLDDAGRDELDRLAGARRRAAA